MNHSLLANHYGLIFAVVCVLLGLIGVISARGAWNRRLTGGLLLQGIVFLFVSAGGQFARAADLRLGALVVVGLFIVRSVISPLPGVEEDRSHQTDNPGLGKDNP